MSIDEPILKVFDLGKLYARNPDRARSRVGRNITRALLGLPLRPAVVTDASERWALKEIDLVLSRGKALGIIGLNGSGKTTLLRILAGQLLPDAGRVDIIGRTASMIDLTAGFTPSATGRENIFLRGAALGRSRAEIVSQMDEIIEFTELGPSIDASISTYSTGMVMRLAFSIMIASRPDLLFIDETLAVGDFTFKQKCLARLRDMRGETAFVMVSHSMNDIKTFCDRVIVLNEGRKVFEGEPSEAVEVYESLRFSDAETKESRTTAVLAPQFHNKDAVQDVRHFWCDASGNEITQISSGEHLFMKVEFTPTHTPRNLILGVPVWLEDGTYITGFSTEVSGEGIAAVRDKRACFMLEVPRLAFNAGVYISNLGITDGPEFLFRGENAPLEVMPSKQSSWGVVSLPHEWRPLNVAEEAPRIRKSQRGSSSRAASRATK